MLARKLVVIVSLFTLLACSFASEEATPTPLVSVADTVPGESVDDAEEPGSEPLRLPNSDIELPRLSEEDEIAIGEEVAAEVEATYGLYHDADAEERIRRIGATIVPHCDRAHLTYHFAVLDTEEINAFAVPGGFIYVTRGMLDYVASDDELAGVIGHEIAHVARRHSAQKIEAITLAIAAGKYLAQRNPDLSKIYERESAQIAGQVTAVLLAQGWSRKQEFAADAYGARYMSGANYRARAIIELFSRLDSDFTSGKPGPAARLLSSHPPFNRRIEKLEDVIVTYGLE